MAKNVLVTADKINKRKKTKKIAKILSLVILIGLTFVFIILSLIYKGGKFIITLDPNSDLETSLALYENSEDKEAKRRLYADEMPFMDNISIKWLPKNIDSEKDGSHNGENYIAYTFYLENNGKDTVNYWYEVIIDDVIKNVDEAIRIMIFRDGEPTVYAKLNGVTNKPEEDTIPFYENRVKKSENIAVLEERVDFTPGDVDKFTVVVWLEGDDPDCVNAIIGGEIKMHMNIREEHKDKNKDKDKDKDKDKEDKSSNVLDNKEGDDDEQE